MAIDEESDIRPQESADPTPDSYVHSRRREAEVLADRVPGSGFSARLYDPVLWLGEKAGLSKWRRKLVAGVEGRVLELGAGTGRNLIHYPSDLEQLTLVEPDRSKAERLARKTESLGLAAEIIRAPAELLPFDDDSFDTVVVTLVFCTMADPLAGATEVMRILKSDGKLLFLEHVRSESERMGRLQDRLERPWMKLADGCHPNRRTVPILREAGFEVEVAASVDRFPMPPVARPLVGGTARPRSQA